MGAAFIVSYLGYHHLFIIQLKPITIMYFLQQEVSELRSILTETKEILQKVNAELERLKTKLTIQDGFLNDYLETFEELWEAGDVAFTPKQVKSYIDCAKYLNRKSEILSEIIDDYNEMPA